MGQQGQAVLFLLPSEKAYIDKLQQHGVKVQQGNLVQHVLQLQELGTAPQQVCFSPLYCPPLPSLPLPLLTLSPSLSVYLCQAQGSFMQAREPCDLLLGKCSIQRSCCYRLP